MRPEPSGYFVLEASGTREATAEEIETEHERFEPLQELIDKWSFVRKIPGVEELLRAPRS